MRAIAEITNISVTVIVNGHAETIITIVNRITQTYRQTATIILAINGITFRYQRIILPHAFFGGAICHDGNRVTIQNIIGELTHINAALFPDISTDTRPDIIFIITNIHIAIGEQINAKSLKLAFAETANKHIIIRKLIDAMTVTFSITMRADITVAAPFRF